MSKGVPVLPVRIEDVVPSSSLELFISSSHWLDAFVPPLEAHLRHLAGVIEQLLATIPPKPVPDPLASKSAESKAAQKINEEANSQRAIHQAEETLPPKKPAVPPPYVPPNFPSREAPTENSPRLASAFAKASADRLRPASEDGPRHSPKRKIILISILAILLLAAGITYKIYRDRAEPPGRFHQVETKIRGLFQ